MSGTNAGMTSSYMDKNKAPNSVAQMDSRRIKPGMAMGSGGNEAMLNKLMEIVGGNPSGGDQWGQILAMFPGIAEKMGGKGLVGLGDEPERIDIEGDAWWDPNTIAKKEGVGKVKANRRAKNRQDKVIAQFASESSAKKGPKVDGSGKSLADAASGNSKIKPTVDVAKEPGTNAKPKDGEVKKKFKGKKVKNESMEY